MWWWDEDRGGKRGSSTLVKYVCGCPPPKNSVRTGRKDLQAQCLTCGTIFKAETVGQATNPTSSASASGQPHLGVPSSTHPHSIFSGERGKRGPAWERDVQVGRVGGDLPQG